MTKRHEDRWPEMRMKHLELLQNVVTRMGNSSAGLKNYCMTLVAGMIGLAAAVQKADILLYAMPIIIVFAILDANYLKLERAFRSQYNVVRQQKIDKEPDFLIETGWGKNHKWYESLWSWSVFWFYAPILIIMLIVYWLME